MLAVLFLLADALVQPGPKAASAVSARRGFLAQTGAAVAASAFVAVAPSQAGYVSNLGFGDAPPASGDVDAEVRGSSAVQSDLKKVQKYADMAKEVAAKMKANPNADIVADIAAFDRAELRTAMNSVNTIFSEDFQKQSDRVVRNVIQDLSELEVIAPMKTGERTPKKAVAIERFTGKLETDLNEFIKYASAK